MSSSSTPAEGPVQAAGIPAGDGTGTEDNGGQSSFSMDIIPEGSADARQSGAKQPGQGKPPAAGEKTVFEGGDPGTEGAAKDDKDKTPSKSDQNAANKEQRQGQAGWQQMTEMMTKLNDRLDKFESGQQAPPEKEKGKDGDKGAQGAPDNAAMQTLVDTLASTNARLERMEFESDPNNADLKTPEMLADWKKVNSDPKFKEFTMDERANHVRGLHGKASADAMHDQLSRAEGSMPRGSGGGAPSRAGKSNITQEDIDVGRAFGFSAQDLESELS